MTENEFEELIRKRFSGSSGLGLVAHFEKSGTVAVEFDANCMMVTAALGALALGEWG